MILALVLLSACASEEAEPTEENDVQATAIAQSSLNQTSKAVVVTGAPVVTATTPTSIQTPPVLQFDQRSNPLPGRGTWLMAPQHGPEKPQPVPWTPGPDTSDPSESDQRTDSR